MTFDSHTVAESVIGLVAFATGGWQAYFHLKEKIQNKRIELLEKAQEKTATKAEQEKLEGWLLSVQKQMVTRPEQEKLEKMLTDTVTRIERSVEKMGQDFREAIRDVVATLRHEMGVRRDE
jgi:Flp pilus assembly protein TadB